MPLSREVFSPYRTRILASAVLSLVLVTGLFHVPLDAASPRIGWAVRSNAPWIDLQDVRETQTEAAASQTAALPVPTRHLPEKPLPAAVGDGSDPSGDAATSGAESAAPPQDRPSLTSIAKLAPENQPELVGGMGALYLNINYPRAAQEQGIEGRLLVEFTVRPDGRTDDLEIVRSLHPLCDSAAVRALRTVRFAPGRQNGQPVPVRMTLPVRFHLADPSSPATASSDGS